MGNWVHTENPEKGTANELSRYIFNLERVGKIYLPNLRTTENLYLFSDYSGNKNQELISYSLLLIDEQSFKIFSNEHKVLWGKYFPDSRIIDYKGLNDNLKRTALIPFLQLCNHLNGLLFTVILNKHTKSIYTDEIPEYLKNRISIWKNATVREKFLRLRDMIFLILNGLAKDSQNVLWVTDNDDIVANKSQIDTASMILKETLSKHLDFGIGTFDLRTLESDSNDKCLEKFCSITDLTAGGIVDFVGDYHKENKIPIEEGIVNPISHTKQKVNPITNWLSKDEEKFKLKKISVLIEETSEGGLVLKALRFPQIF